MSGVLPARRSICAGAQVLPRTIRHSSGMPVPPSTGPGPGWHPDPNDPTKLRWRDATGWTDHVAPLPAAPPAATDRAPFVATVADPPADALSAALETARAARSGLVMAQPWSGGVTATAPAPRGHTQAASPPAEPVAEPEPEATAPETTDAGAAKPSPSPAQKPAGLALRARRLRARRRAAEAAVPDPATEPV